MKRKIIEAMTYPRMLMMSRWDSDDCRLNHFYSPSHPDCWTCEQGTECQWLNSNDEFTVLANQPRDVLLKALRFSIDYVDTNVSSKDHNARRCVCESCRWLRNSRRMAREYEDRSARNRNTGDRRIS